MLCLHRLGECVRSLVCELSLGGRHCDCRSVFGRYSECRYSGACCRTHHNCIVLCLLISMHRAEARNVVLQMNRVESGIGIEPNMKRA